MALTGACCNQPTNTKLGDANRARAALVALGAVTGPTIKIMPRPDPMQPMIVLVLQASPAPLAIREIVERVERALGRSVHRVSVKAALSEMAGSGNHSVRRVSRGVYEASAP